MFPTFLFVRLGGVCIPEVSSVSRVSLYLLGSYHVTIDGKPITEFRSDKARALLAYLAVESDRPHPREFLAALLWPDVPEDTARSNLRLTLHRLRKALHDTGSESHLFHITRETVQARPDAFWVDVLAFNQALARAREHPHADIEHCRECAGQLARAVSLYRGSFLHGLSLRDSLLFADWVVLLRERLHRFALDALHCLAEYHRRRGELERAEIYARRQVELEPWREEGHYQLMDILARRGEFSAALRQYEACRRILAKELALTPSPRTHQLYERILRLRASPHPNLPARPGLFVGRAEEMARMAALLTNPDCRLITVHGPPGAGKTRLALEAAAAHAYAFLDGVHFVSLAGVEASEHLDTAIAQALDLPLQSTAPLRQQVIEHLKPREILLVLDNVEHLLASPPTGPSPVIAFLLAILEQARGVKVIVTSRHRLHLRWEWVVEVDGLPYPQVEDRDGSERDFPALRLFTLRAQQTSPHLVPEREAAAIARICRAVEGMPLAIELAAAAVRHASCAEIAARLEHTLDVLRASHPDLPPRHRSLRAAFEHSWRLLSQDEQEALMRLSVFRGGFSGDAAQDVAGTSPRLLASLVDKALLQRGDGNRFTMHEFVRAYAHEKLRARPPLDADTGRRHARHFARLLHEHVKALRGTSPQAALETIGRDLDNVRAAWQWAVTQGDDEVLAQAEEGLYLFFEMRGLFHEGESAFRAATDHLLARGNGATPHLLARCLLRQGWFCWRLGRYDRACDLLQQGLRLARENGRPEDVVFGLGPLGLTMHNMGVEAEAERCYQEGLTLARAIGDEHATLRMLYRLGLLYYSLDRHEEAKSHFAEALALARAIGDERAIAFGLGYLGLVYGDLGAHERARSCCEEGLARCQALGDAYGIGLCHTYLGRVLARAGAHAEAEAHLRSGITQFRKVGDDHGLAYALEQLGELHCRQRAYARARECYRESLDLYRKVGSRGGTLRLLGLLGYVTFRQGNHHEARRVLRQRRQEIGRAPRGSI